MPLSAKKRGLYAEKPSFDSVSRVTRWGIRRDQVTKIEIATRLVWKGLDTVPLDRADLQWTKFYGVYFFTKSDTEPATPFVIYGRDLTELTNELRHYFAGVLIVYPIGVRPTLNKVPSVDSIEA